MQPQNSIFACPVCKEGLTYDGRTLKCQNGHSFDLAKEGYVNLLTGKGSAVSGDDKMMVSSRTRFLEAGYYAPLRDKVSSLIKDFSTDGAVLLDSGCGEGYYTKEYSRLVSRTAGIDISKTAIKHASKVCKEAEFAVASVYHLPICDEVIDIVVNCFSPMAPDEFSRVMKKGGYLLYVVPGKRHLWELKTVLYENPYENEEKIQEYEGFEHLGVHSVKTAFSLDNAEDISALYHMTPYTWTTPKDGAEKLSKVSHLDITAEFYVHIYRKI